MGIVRTLVVFSRTSYGKGQARTSMVLSRTFYGKGQWIGLYLQVIHTQALGQSCWYGRGSGEANSEPT